MQKLQFVSIQMKKHKINEKDESTKECNKAHHMILQTFFYSDLSSLKSANEGHLVCNAENNVIKLFIYHITTLFLMFSWQCHS